MAMNKLPAWAYDIPVNDSCQFGNGVACRWLKSIAVFDGISDKADSCGFCCLYQSILPKTTKVDWCLGDSKKHAACRHEAFFHSKQYHSGRK
jgi:hypothetical protein